MIPRLNYKIVLEEVTPEYGLTSGRNMLLTMIQ